MTAIKPYITYGFAIVLFLFIIITFNRLISEGIPTPTVTTGPFSQALWTQWGLAVLILAFIALAGAASVLVLLGGGWRWD